jgi:3-oxoacyl-[acyl-carrier-protein] synthase-3
MTLSLKSAPAPPVPGRTRSWPAMSASEAAALSHPSLVTRHSSLPLSAGIYGIGSCVPDRVLTNADLERMVETSDEWILTRTGISERRIVAPGEATSDLATTAGRRALEHAGLTPADLDLIIVATITPDMPFPAVSNLVQDRLGASRAAAFDLGAACSGFIYGLATAKQFIATGFYRHVLVIGADALSSVVNWSDRSTCVLFGDGAGAAVLGPVPDGSGLLAFDLGSDGSGAELLCVEAGGSRLPASAETVANLQHTIRMNGTEVFKFAVRVMEESTLRALAQAGMTTDDVDCFIAHQANIRILDAASKRLGLPAERVFNNVHRYGNTSAASVPIAMVEALAEGRFGNGDTLALVGFGAGLSWASTIMTWTR